MVSSFELVELYVDVRLDDKSLGQRALVKVDNLVQQRRELVHAMVHAIDEHFDSVKFGTTRVVSKRFRQVVRVESTLLIHVNKKRLFYILFYFILLGCRFFTRNRLCQSFTVARPLLRRAIMLGM